MDVSYMAHSGDDLLVVDAARVSFSKKSEWEVSEEFGEDEQGAYIQSVNSLATKDIKLLNFLARDKHLLPFRHPQVTLRCKAPIFVARQLGKHQVGFSWSEESRRYIKSEPEFYWPDKWRKAAANVKQGSSDEEVVGIRGAAYTVQEGNEQLLGHANSAYNEMLANGVAPELARMILPQNMYVNWVWTGSLLGWYQLYSQRSEGTAQKESRDFAELVKEQVAPLYPQAWAALEENCKW